MTRGGFLKLSFRIKQSTDLSTVFAGSWVPELVQACMARCSVGVVGGISVFVYFEIRWYRIADVTSGLPGTLAALHLSVDVSKSRCRLERVAWHRCFLASFRSCSMAKFF